MLFLERVWPRKEPTKSKKLQGTARRLPPRYIECPCIWWFVLAFVVLFFFVCLHWVPCICCLPHSSELGGFSQLKKIAGKLFKNRRGRPRMFANCFFVPNKLQTTQFVQQRSIIDQRLVIPSHCPWFLASMVLDHRSTVYLICS